MESNAPNERIPYGSLLVLTFVARFVDAASFVSMGHVFTANMTCNVVFMALAAGNIPGLSFGKSATAFGFFVIGGFAASRLDHAAAALRRKPKLAIALTLEAGLLLAAAGTSLDLPGDHRELVASRFGPSQRRP